MMKVYAVPSYNCNLDCPHCDIHNLKFESNFEQFLQTLRTLKGEIILFGGEPLIHPRLKEILDTRLINTISSNLLNLHNLEFKIDIPINTSWNPNRFNPQQYLQWLENLRLINKVTVMITLTEDLLEINPHTFVRWINTWPNVESILFEHLVSDNTGDLHRRADNWLCKVHKCWDTSIHNLILDKLKNWDCDCKNVFTLQPNGELTRGCPQYNKVKVIDKCWSCKLVDICRPCVLQDTCTYPYNLAKLIGV